MKRQKVEVAMTYEQWKVEVKRRIKRKIRRRFVRLWNGTIDILLMLIREEA